MKKSIPSGLKLLALGGLAAFVMLAMRGQR